MRPSECLNEAAMRTPKDRQQPLPSCEERSIIKALQLDTILEHDFIYPTHGKLGLDSVLFSVIQLLVGLSRKLAATCNTSTPAKLELVMKRGPVSGTASQQRLSSSFRRIVKAKPSCKHPYDSRHGLRDITRPMVHAARQSARRQDRCVGILAHRRGRLHS